MEGNHLRTLTKKKYPTITTTIQRMLQTSNMSSKFSSTHTSCTFYSLPRNVVLRIFTSLPLSSLLKTQQVSRRFRILITRSHELRPYLFLEPPQKSPPSANVSIFLHPVFERLHFFAYHSAKAVRIGEGLNSVFLQKSGVREQFATSPALEELVVRVISGGKWPLDAEIVIENKEGVNVWDVLQGITKYFSQYEKVSFGEHFGEDICEQRGYNPKVLMQNHDFLDPDLPFPTIIFPDRDCNKVFIADYAFNAFAAQPLIKLPAEWYTEEKKEVKGLVLVEELELDVGKAPEEGKISDETRSHRQIGQVKAVEQLGDPAAGGVEAQKTKQTLKTDENPDDDMKDEVHPIGTGSTGSQSMGTDYNSTHENQKNQIDQSSSRDQGGGSISIGEAGALSRKLTLEALADCEPSNITGALTSSLKPSEPPSLINSSRSKVERVGPTSGDQAAPSTGKSTFQNIKPAEALVELATNTDTKVRGETLYILPIKAPATMANEPRDWDDVFS